MEIRHCRQGLLLEIIFKQKIISFKVKNKIVWGLNKIRNEIIKKKFTFNPKFEDIHMSIEKRLFEIKKRDLNKPVPILISSLNDISNYCDTSSETLQKLAKI